MGSYTTMLKINLHQKEDLGKNAKLFSDIISLLKCGKCGSIPSKEVGKQLGEFLMYNEENLSPDLDTLNQLAWRPLARFQTKSKDQTFIPNFKRIASWETTRP